MIAAIGVISLHVGTYPDLSETAVDVIHSSFRWCVPFFFMLTGYYLADLPKITPKLTAERLAVPLRAFAVANIVFLPVLLASSGADGLSLSTLLRGSYGHLWYLTALIIALLAVCSLRTKFGINGLWFVAAAVLLSYVGLNYFFAITGRRYEAVMTLRELSGIPAILVGGWLRKSGHDRRAFALLLLAAGFSLTVMEAVLLSRWGGHPGDVQLFAGTLLLSAGLLVLAVSTRDIAPAWLAQFGREESLGIYLYHPVAILIIASLVSRKVRLSPAGLSGIPLWIGAVILTMGALFLLRLWRPKLRRALDGMQSGSSAH